MVSLRQMAPIVLLLACRSPLPAAPVDAGADSAAPPPTFSGITLPDDLDGARLQRSWWKAPTGVSVPGGGIIDRKLGVGCTWSMLEDGFRCVPARGTTTRYSDAACAHPLLVHDPHSCAPVPDYVGIPANTLTCPASTGVRRRGPRVSPEAPYFRTLEGECTVAPQVEGLEFYEVGEEVPATTFVGATQVVEPVPNSGGGARIYLEAEDGSRWVRFMRWGDYDCTAARAADGVLRCLPRVAGSVSAPVFDADCKTPVVQGARSSCDVERILLSDSDEAVCPIRTAVHRAARRLDTAYVKLGDTCWPLQDPLREAYTVGEELPPGQFVEVSRGLIDAPGRLKRMAISTPAGVYGLSSFWDSQLGFACVPVLARDGTQRCAAGPFVVARPFFADPQCTRSVTTENPCVFPSLLMSMPGLCPVRDRIFRIGAVIKVERPYMLDAGGRCVPAFGTLPPSTVFHEVREWEPGELVELSLGP